MGHPGAFLRRGLGGADIHVPVDLHGIETDDLAGKTLGQGEGERGLAHGGGADEDKHGFGEGCFDSRASHVLRRILNI